MFVSQRTFPTPPRTMGPSELTECVDTGASTTGSLSEDNCHPWRWGQSHLVSTLHCIIVPFAEAPSNRSLSSFFLAASLLWMANGNISNFRLIIRALQADLSDEFYHMPLGNTDSEWAFALFLECLSKVRFASPSLARFNSTKLIINSLINPIAN